MWVQAQRRVAVNQWERNQIHVHKAEQMGIQFVQTLCEHKAGMSVGKGEEYPGEALTDMLSCLDFKVSYEP